MQDEFRLSDRLDWDCLARAFAVRGRVEISDLLVADQAAALRDHLLSRQDWRVVLNAGDKVYELTRADYAGLGHDRRAELDRHILATGRDGFQFRYETIRVPDGPDDRRTHDDDMLARFIAFLSSPALCDAFNTLLGIDDIAFADGQATSYGAGHFLTSHDDDVDGKHRRAAYVYSLAPQWRPEWGGLLMFHGADGHIDEAFAPKMGALRLFRVPQLHSVSYVTPFAAEPRLSVTGWLRAHGQSSV